jgi:hypothetical protein
MYGRELPLGGSAFVGFLLFCLPGSLGREGGREGGVFFF